MGKGDRRSRRGKIRLGSYGNTRRRKKSKFRFIPKQKAKPVLIQQEVKETVAPVEITQPLQTALAETPIMDTAAVETASKAAKPKKAAVKKTPVKKTPAKKVVTKKPVKKK